MPLVRKPGASPRKAVPAPADIAEGLASSSEEVRWSAARAAAEAKECVLPLAAALRVESSPRVREAMFTALARIGTADSAAGILPLLRSDDAGLRAGALDALRLMMSNGGELLASLLRDEDVDVRILSCELARGLPGDEATALLCGLLKHEQDGNVCAAALDVLAEMGQSDALPVLAECAARFRDTPFLAFAIQVTVDRIRSQSSASRG